MRLATGSARLAPGAAPVGAGGRPGAHRL